MLRSSNLVPISRHKFYKRRVLTWGALFRVTASKTFQFNEPTQEVPLAPADDPMFFPVKALSDMATMGGINKITADTCFSSSPVPAEDRLPCIKVTLKSG